MSCQCRCLHASANKSAIHSWPHQQGQGLLAYHMSYCHVMGWHRRS